MKHLTASKLCFATACMVLSANVARAQTDSVAATRHATENQCGALVRNETRLFSVDHEQNQLRWTDLDAHYWQLTTPIAYLGGEAKLVARERFRVGDGAILVESRIFPTQHRYEINITPEPAGDFEKARKKYLPNIVLPCHTTGQLAIKSETGAPQAIASDRRIRHYRLLHQASELIYDDRFAEAKAALSEAQKLRPDLETALWLEARVHFLEAETLPTTEKSKRLAAYQTARARAEQAIRVNPKSAEAHLWLAIAEGRIATSQGNLRAALDSILESGGPALIANSFERAIALEAKYVHFGYSAHSDALNGAAQFYRLMPESRFVSSLLGVAGNLDRSVDLAQQAFDLQPDRIEYAKELGVSLLCRGAKAQVPHDLEKAKQALQSALAQTAYTKLEIIDQQQIRRLLQIEPSRACAYSRDGWQDGHGKVEGSS